MTMNETKHYVTVSKQELTPDTISVIPSELHDAFVVQLKAMISPKDYARGEFTVPYDALTLADLTHPAIAKELDVEASSLAYTRIRIDDAGKEMHAIVARGSNPMGVILSQDGELAFRIVDRQVEEQTPQDAGVSAAIEALVFYGEAGSTVEDLREQLKQNDSWLYREIFDVQTGDATPVLVYSQADLPASLAELMPDPQVYFYLLANTDEIETFLKDNVDVFEWDHPLYNDAMNVAQMVLNSASKSKSKLYEVLAPGIDVGVRVPWALGFSDENMAPIFGDNGYRVVGIEELL